jgi:hypothetical protein
VQPCVSCWVRSGGVGSCGATCSRWIGATEVRVMVKSGEKAKRKSNNPAGRPVTVGASADFHVRVSPELMAKVQATLAAQHVTLSESLRLVLELIADSPGDMLAAMAADPEAARTVFVERMTVAALRKAAAR